MNSMLGFIKKYRERVTLLGVVLAFLISIGAGVYLQKNKVRERPAQHKQDRVVVKHGPAQSKTNQQASQRSGAEITYFIEPSPTELLAQLASMENLNSNTIDEKFQQLPVLWPGYFFSCELKDDGRTVLLLDVSEDGFGVVLESDVDLRKYPELKGAKPGDKIWIGGKILAVDPSGTGKVYLEAEQLSFGMEPPYE